MLMSKMFDFKTIEVVDVKVSGAEGPCVVNVNILSWHFILDII